ncbi:MAG: PilN domain-containing protein [Sporomusaceae bacterium]|nr:PilN domain-containing protein [Sporomusaceae bacterium]
MLINLLPPRQRVPYWQTARFLAIATVAVAVCLVFIWGGLVYSETDLEARLQQVVQQHELLQPTLAQLAHAEAKENSLRSGRHILLALTQERLPLYAGIVRLGASVTETVWLVEVNADKNGLKVSGLAQSYADATAFFALIRKDALFKDFSLIRIEQEPAGTLFEFRTGFGEI